jgi:hypothetical protein
MVDAKYSTMLAQPVMRRPVPGTDLMLEVEKIIRDATWAGETPISLAEVKRRMRQRSPKHQQVRDLINLLGYLGRVSETSDGVEYTYMAPEAARRLAHKKL